MSAKKINGNRPRARSRIILRVFALASAIAPASVQAQGPIAPAYVCGDGVCDVGEDLSCADDCKWANNVCGNGICEWGEGGENCATCPKDCGLYSTNYSWEKYGECTTVYESDPVVMYEFAYWIFDSCVAPVYQYTCSSCEVTEFTKYSCDWNEVEKVTSKELEPRIHCGWNATDLEDLPTFYCPPR
jgi:hypothetical protein